MQNAKAGTISDDEIESLRGPSHVAGYKLHPADGQLSNKFARKTRVMDRTEGWFATEYSTIKQHITTMGIPSSEHFWFHVYWLSKRYACSEKNVVDGMAKCCTKWGTRYAADSFRLGNNYKFKMLVNAGKVHTGLAYAPGIESTIKIFDNWGRGFAKAKAGRWRIRKVSPNSIKTIPLKWMVEVQPFSAYVIDKVCEPGMNRNAIKLQAIAILAAKQLESREMTMLWRDLIGQVLGSRITFLATALMPLNERLVICQQLTEIEGHPST